MLPRIRQGLRVVLAYLVVLVGWFHALISPVGEWLSVSVLGALEESWKSVVREWFRAGVRWTNEVSDLLLSVFTRQNYPRRRRKAAAERSKAWTAWWTSAHSTFNALAEMENKPQPRETEDDDGHIAAVNGPLSARREHRTAPLPQVQPQPSWWRLLRRRSSGHLAYPAVVQGSVLFAPAAAGAAVADVVRRRGLVEDARVQTELGIAKAFAAIRHAVRAVFFLDRQPSTPKRAATTSAGFQFPPAKEEFTAGHAILQAGYPLEEYVVTTPDGYELNMQRIPRHEARNAVFLVHGVLDTSLSWVSSGAVGSAAFAAHDAGFDVWLANTRANPPRKNVRPDRQGSRYWHFTINDLALSDMAAQIEFIHVRKMEELKGAGQPLTLLRSGSVDTARGGQGMRHSTSSGAQEAGPSSIAITAGGSGRLDGLNDESLDLRRTRSADLPDHSQRLQDLSHAGSACSASSSEHATSSGAGDASAPPSGPATEELPYRLQAVGHSLGAASLLMYAVACRMQDKPHRLHRLVLLSPAGFHTHVPLALRPCVHMIPPLVAVVDWLWPGRGMGLRLPSSPLRWVAFKLVADLRQVPALMDLFAAFVKMVTSGDTSAWHEAMSLPHYSSKAMPALSLHCGNHFAQWAKDPTFRFYDYGKGENTRRYGADVPPSVAHNYGLLDIPVDLAAGSSDGLIPRRNVEAHLAALRAGGVRCSLQEFDYGHLDFTFGVREEVVRFVLSRLRQSALAS